MREEREGETEKKTNKGRRCGKVGWRVARQSKEGEDTDVEKEEDEDQQMEGLS